MKYVRNVRGNMFLTPKLLQTLPVPLHAWSHVSMDFIEELPNSGGKDTIMVLVDRFT